MSLAITSLLISAILFCFGVRGRRLGSHPVCRKCGYNLSGKPAGANACSECGSDLNRKAAIRVGNRRRRWGAIIAAAAISLASTAWLGSPRVRDLATRDWEPFKPSFWLIHDVSSGNGTLAQQATDELNRRLIAGKLNNGDVKRLASTLLRLQPGTPPTHFDEILELARAHGQLGGRQWQQYWRQAFPLQLCATRESGPIELVHLSLDSGQRNWRFYHLSSFQIEAIGRTLRIGSHAFDAADLKLLTAVREEGAGGVGCSHDIPLAPADPPDLAARQVVISVHVDLIITDLTPGQTKELASIPVDLDTKVALPAGKVLLETESD